MKTAENIFIYIAVMALVTYLIRMLPLVIFAKNRKQIYKIVSLLHSVCSIGGDDISRGFSSTGSVWSAVAGLIVALLLAFLRRACSRLRCPPASLFL